MRRLILALLVVVAASALAPAGAPAAAATPPARPGLAVATLRADGRQLLAVTSAGRFELRLDEGGIVAWYDLRRDPGRAANLVAHGRTLVSHLGPDGEPLRAPWSVELATPVLARVAWRGPGFTRTYTVWAAGQVSITATGEGAPMALARRAAATTGAALQADGPGAVTLFLDAWTGEDRPAALAAGPSGAVLAAQAAGGAATIVAPPEAGLRAPRLAVAGWPGPAHALRQGGALLVEGQDYLAHWDGATGTLYAQVLAALPPGAPAAARTFSLLQQATPGLSLGVEGRTLSPDGMLQVDGNMPDNVGRDSTFDLFFIPYIQATQAITLTAVYQGPGAGVELVLAGQSRTVLGPAGSLLAAGFTLPAYGEYQAEGYIVDEAGARLGATPDDTIAPLALGRIILTIGDSITAGQFGDELGPTSPSYPVSDYTRSPAHSLDRRTFYQYNNRNGGGFAAFRRGYQVTLSDMLAACGGAPVFILNEGYDGLHLTSRERNLDLADNDSALAKIAAYRGHIEQLGARHVLIQLGTNDVRVGRAATFFRNDLRALVAGLWAGGYGLEIWFARIPWTDFRGTPPENLADRQERILNFNREIVRLAEALYNPLRPVRLGPDLYTFFASSPDLLADGLHPSQAGYEAMAGLWAAPSGVGINTLPCRAFAEEGDAPPPPLSLTPGVWLPALRR